MINKKRIILITLLISALLPVTSYATDKGASPVAHWAFDECGGPTAYDESTNNNDGTLTPGAGGTNTATGQMWTRQGKIGGALECDGTDDWMDGGTTVNLKLTNFTISAWFKWNSEHSVDPIRVILAKGANNGSGFYDNYRVYVNDSNKKISVSVGNAGYTSYWGITSDTVVSSGIWYYVAVSFDSTGYMKLYVNGVSNATPIAVGLPAAPNGNFEIGSWKISSSGDMQYGEWDGLIDDVRIYNYARTPQQILVDYNAGSAVHLSAGTDPNEGNPPVGYWNFDEASGQSAYDRSGSGYNGQLGATAGSEASDPAWTNAGKNGGALSFDGTDDYVNMGDLNSLDGLEKISISFWLKPTANSGGDGIIDKSSNGCTFFIEYGVVVANNICFGTAGSTYGYTPSINLNQWYNVNIVFDGSQAANDTKLKIYLNGVSQNLTFVGTLPATLPSSAAPLHFGGYTHVANRYFPGLIDDVKIYNYARMQAQIAYDYNKGKPIAHYMFDEGGGAIAHNESSTADSGTAPVAWWRMDEGTGGTTADASGRGNTGTLYPQTGGTNTITANMWDQTGKIGPDCLEFDGTDDYLVTPTLAVHTVEMWVKPSSTQTKGAPTYYNQSGQSNTVPYWWVYTSGAGTALYWQGTDGVAIQAKSWTNAITYDTWNHLAFVFDNTGKTITLYKNGVSLGTQSCAGVLVPSGSFYMGIYQGASSNYPLNGLIDDVRIYNYARTAEQIYNDYKTTHCTLVDDTKFVDGKIGKALSFDGTGDYVDIGDVSAYPLTGAVEATIGFWAKADTTAGNMSFFGSHNPIGERLYIAIHDGNWDMGIDGNGWGVGHSGTLKAATTNWTYITVTFSGGTAIMYVNGEQTITKPYTSIDITGFIPVGAMNEYGSLNFGIDGKIDDFRIYNYARTVSQILDDYNAGASTYLGGQSAGVSDPWGGAMPIAHWTLDENTGVLAQDASGNANNGTLGGDGAGTDVPTWTQGKLGPCLSFDGTDDYVYTALSSSATLTIEAWAKFGGGNRMLWCIDNDSQGPDLYFSGGNIALNTWDGITNSFCAQPSNVSDWHHYSTVIESGNTKLYIDGVYAGTATYKNPTGTSFYISMPSSWRWMGSIDDVKIYNYARTQAQIAWDYNRGKSVAHWQFDEASDGSSADGDTIYDDSLNNNDATGNDGANNTGLTWTQGKFNGAISFDGVDDYVSVGTAINSILIGNLTFSAWIKPSAFGANRGIARTRYNQEFAFMITDTDGHLQWLQGNGTNYQGSATVNGIVTLNVFQHVAVTRDTSAKKLYFYINGILTDIKDYTYGPPSVASAYPLLIGEYEFSDRWFQGIIDDVRIYNYARTAEQILEDYNAGSAAYLGD